MHREMRVVAILYVPLLWLVVAGASAGRAPAGEPSGGDGETQVARQILEATGVRGGLVVHVGCGDGRLTAALRPSDHFLVQGLDADRDNVAKARQRIGQCGLSGQVTADTFDGQHLPYAGSLVNLLVVGEPYSIPPEEMMRVLRPGGVAYVKEGGGWSKTVKPWPPEMDEWTHFLHAADGNAVAADRLVGPPRHVQWLEGPLWSRHHDTVPSINALVSAGGRIVYMVDEAPACIGGEIPDRWSLAARDAFNGVLLWKRPVEEWGWKAWSGTWLGRFNQPNNVPKRLVAAGDRVYVTLGFNAPLVALDAATGEVLRTYEGTEYTDEVLYHRDTLVLSVNHAAQKPGTVAENPPVEKSVAAVDPVTARILWKTGSYVGTSSKTGSVERVSHLLLAARGDGVFLGDTEAIVALDLKTGRERWRAPRPEHKRYTSRYNHLMSDLCTLVATDEVVLFAQLEPIQKRIGWGVIKTGLYAFSTEDGQQRWSRVVGNWGHFCVPDVFFVGGLVWVHDYESVAMVGLDPLSGEQKRRVSTAKWFRQGHHHRCYRNKATERFILTGYRGVEFLDLEAATHTPHHWSRGGCRYGILPCNGLLYSTPHPCACYIKAKLNGLYALAPQREEGERERGGEGEKEERLLRGPAFEKLSAPRSPLSAPEDWPTYRHDAARSGSTPAAVPAELRAAWSTPVAARLSPPVVAGGKVLVSAVDEGTVHALDAKDGTPLWSRTVGGRVRSPPTVHGNLVLFGSAHGWVHAVRLADGELVWRLRAAPEDRRIVAFGRVESAWPVDGGVLVQDHVAYFAAGRSSYLDRGIHVYSADPARGKVISHQRIYSPDPETGRQPPQSGPQEMPGALADVLVGSDQGVTMRHLRVDAGAGEARSPGAHLVCTAGFLDDSWFNRTSWSLGRVAGQLLVFDDETVCGVRAYSGTGRSGFFFPGKGYEVFTADRRAGQQDNQSRANRKKEAARWTRRVPIRVRAMVLAGERLCIAGPPDVADADGPWAAFEGRRGGVLAVLDAGDGHKVADYELSAPPVWDGMAAATGRLLLSTRDGRVVCIGP